MRERSSVADSCCCGRSLSSAARASIGARGSERAAAEPTLSFSGVPTARASKMRHSLKFRGKIGFRNGRQKCGRQTPRGRAGGRDLADSAAYIYHTREGRQGESCVPRRKTTKNSSPCLSACRDRSLARAIKLRLQSASSAPPRLTYLLSYLLLSRDQAAPPRRAARRRDREALVRWLPRKGQG